MKTCKWCLIEQPLENFHKHRGMKEGRLNKCSACVVKSVDAWRQENPNCRKVEHAKNRERKGFLTREDYYKELSENAMGRSASSLKYSHKRRTQIAVDCEFTDFVVEEMCLLRDLRAKATGFSWHIDHIVPLNHKKASGLHLYTNLQLVPGLWNNQKLNLNMDVWEYSFRPATNS